MNQLTVSVALCTYNGEKYIEEQLNSILAQTVPVQEIIIVDDRSSDRTLELCQQILQASTVDYTILQNDVNSGASRSFEKCILQCKNDIIFTSDQDDVWKPHKVERMLQEFYQDPSCMLAFSDAHLVDQNLSILNPSSWDALCFPLFGIHGSGTSVLDYKKALMCQTVVFGNVMAFRRQLAEKILPMPHDQGWLHDNWFGICAPIYGNVSLVEEQLIFYRQHGKNACGISSKFITKEDKIIYHTQRVILYFKQNAFKLSIFLKHNREHMDSEYISLIQEHISLFKKLPEYRGLSSWKKICYLFYLFISNRLQACLISRKDLFIYIKHYLKEAITKK